MSKANDNTSGNQGKNMPFQWNMLQSQGAMINAITGGFSALITLLGTKEYEAKLVEDSAGTPVTWLEVRVYNTGTGTFDPPVYYLAGSTIPGSPTLPIFYLNDSTILSTIASNTTGLATQVTLAAVNAKLAALGQKASAGSMPVVLSTEQEAMIDQIEALLTTIDADTSNLDVALSTVASNATLLLTNGLLTTIDTVLDNILLDTAAIKTATEAINTKLTTVVRTPGMLRVTAAGAGSVTAGKRAITIWNYGNTTALVLGQNLLRGEKVSWSAGAEEDTLGAITYNAQTSDLLITWTV